MVNVPKIPVSHGFSQNPYYQDDIIGALCRKKGQVTVEFCSLCPEFEPACTGISDDDELEGNDGIDPKTGNSYATCKWFGRILRRNRPMFQGRKIA